MEACSHGGPVWQVAWAHPKFGHILASCSYDGKVFIWKEEVSAGAHGGWNKIKEHSLHTASGQSKTSPPMSQRLNSDAQSTR
jgi:protein transport protein SEC13